MPTLHWKCGMSTSIALRKKAMSRRPEPFSVRCPKMVGWRSVPSRFCISIGHLHILKYDWTPCKEINWRSKEESTNMRTLDISAAVLRDKFPVLWNIGDRYKCFRRRSLRNKNPYVVCICGVKLRTRLEEDLALEFEYANDEKEETVITTAITNAVNASNPTSRSLARSGAQTWEYIKLYCGKETGLSVWSRSHFRNMLRP